MTRSFAAFSLVSAGVFMLAGLGWGLLAAGGLCVVLWRKDPDWAAVAARARAGFGKARAQAAARPRRATAVGGMASGVALLPAGLALSAGAGVALAAGGVLLIGVGLLTGWGQ